MAEIRLEPKRRMGWPWLVLLLIIVALVLWWLWQSGYLGGTRISADTQLLHMLTDEFALRAAGAGTA